MKIQDIRDLLRDSEPPAHLPPVVAAAWRRVAPRLELRLRPGSPAERELLRDPEDFERWLLALFEHTCALVAQFHMLRECGLPPPELGSDQRTLLALFGLEPPFTSGQWKGDVQCR